MHTHTCVIINSVLYPHFDFDYCSSESLMPIPRPHLLIPQGIGFHAWMVYGRDVCGISSSLSQMRWKPLQTTVKTKLMMNWCQSWWCAVARWSKRWHIRMTQRSPSLCTLRASQHLCSTSPCDWPVSPAFNPLRKFYHGPQHEWPHLYAWGAIIISRRHPHFLLTWSRGVIASFDFILPSSNEFLHN